MLFRYHNISILQYYFLKCKIWIVCNQDHAKLGLCKIWILKILDLENFGSCKPWIMQNLDGAKFRLRKIQITQNLGSARFKTCKIRENLKCVVFICLHLARMISTPEFSLQTITYRRRSHLRTIMIPRISLKSGIKTTTQGACNNYVDQILPNFDTLLPFTWTQWVFRALKQQKKVFVTFDNVFHVYLMRGVQKYARN